MKSFHSISWGLIVSGFIVLFLIGCTGESVKIDLPHNHPANPAAQETAFITPLNPFQDHVQIRLPGTQKKQVPSHQHQMTHEMEQMGKDSMSAPEPGGEKDDHQHSIHKQ